MSAKATETTAQATGVGLRNVTPETLSPAQRAAINSLLGGSTVTGAAAAARVSRKTLHGWLKKSCFCSVLRIQQARLLESVGYRTAALLHRSIDAIEDGLADSDVKIRIKSAEIYLGKCTIMIEHLLGEQRLRRIESVLFDEEGEANDTEQ